MNECRTFDILLLILMLHFIWQMQIFIYVFRKMFHVIITTRYFSLIFAYLVLREDGARTNSLAKEFSNLIILIFEDTFRRIFRHWFRITPMT